MTDKTSQYIDNSGNIIVPFNADPKYHFWNGGQSLSVTLQEVNAKEDLWNKYFEKPYPGYAARAENED